MADIYKIFKESVTELLSKISKNLTKIEDEVITKRLTIHRDLIPAQCGIYNTYPELKLEYELFMAREPDFLPDDKKFIEQVETKIKRLIGLSDRINRLMDKNADDIREEKRIFKEKEEKIRKEKEKLAKEEEKKSEDEKIKLAKEEENKKWIEENSQYVLRCLRYRNGYTSNTTIDDVLRMDIDEMKETITLAHMDHNEDLLRGTRHDCYYGCEPGCYWEYKEHRCNCGNYKGFTWSTEGVDWLKDINLDSCEYVGRQVRQW